jgi:hypothetical protein
MTKQYHKLDDFEEPDYDSFDVQIDFRFIGGSTFLNPDKYSNQAKIIIDRLQPDGICHEGGAMALYFTNGGISTTVLIDSYWKQITPDFKLINYSDYENNIYINSFDKPYAGIVN